MYQPGLSCLKKIVLVIFVSLLGTNLGVAGGGDKLAPSSRGNNTRVREFTFERQVSKTNRDFLVREEGGNNVLQVTSRFNRPGSYVSFQMTVTNSYMHSFAIGIESAGDINRSLEWCGYRQTYRTSDGVDYEIDPRGGLTDRWAIKGGKILAQDYYWDRKSMGLAGPIKDRDGRHVAHFHAKRWGHEWLAMLFNTNTPRKMRYSIKTNDEIPIEYLVGLFTVAIIRMDKCGR
ncbi:hypothetical protein PCASD_04212 [Puccinia coronata f. sp. avenae]|uniref:Uncharacterized protein n=1 Tax=Puccinia coronata f. sp. avenae TaxID=200324 RepID=A0A2N5V7W4_9BASI|nr:hypothetical protein PCASD_26261 [Puccinia coronata f. sp. avenae]PLW46099.1 hypothetical protein PCASD_04212 [Puccinia coronata f. sp. avenae]